MTSAKTKSHTLRLRLQDNVVVSVTYEHTDMDWVDFMNDAAALLTEYTYSDMDFVSVTTTERH
jgi:hypothetical protein